ncbi:MAG: leucine-rich repeat domain-containing protein [Chloroflexi bacterium]|nr:leucine-rich repeat domain-containing protein [Chloroflexota bacterium]
MTLETALARIRQAAETGDTSLDLSRLGLTALPPEIGALTSLQELDLRGNQLTALPPELWKLPALKRLDISSNPLTEIPPQLWRKTDWEELGLRSLNLTALPPEIWELPALKRLDISDNPLPEIPPELWRKTDWEALGLSGLNLTSLPPEIGALTSLQELDLRGNQLDISSNPLTEIPPQLWRKTDWEELGLRSLNLTALPPEIGQLANLQALDLSSNQLTALPPEIGQLANLQTLNLQLNHLTALPSEIGALIRLQKLDLSGNQLTTLPPEIGQLANLQTLQLRYNRLTSLPPEIGALTRLQELGLWSNQLTALPPEIGQLANLQTLDLKSNQLAALPPEIGALTRLQELDLWSNQLTALPPEVWKLPALKQLDISGNQLPEIPPELWRKTDWEELGLSGLNLTALPREVWELPALKRLDISDNPLPEIPPELWRKTDWEELGLGRLNLTALPPEIGALTRLQELNLGRNQLTALPPEIGQLANLKTLQLWNNQLTALLPEIGALSSLQRLDLQDNQLTALPPEIGQLANLQRLNLNGNPLTLALPRALLGYEIFGGNAQEIFRFYRAIWQEGRTLGEARILFIGQPAAGKTSLVWRLKDGSYRENRPSTMTVETHATPFGDFTARVWDFGGQDFMHATHPFFFSARCVYVLVLNVRQTYEQNRVEYWLRTIRAFGGDSPVIIVGNHADAEQHVLDLPQNRLKRDFPNIAAFVQTSASENAGIKSLRAALQEAIESLPHVRVLFARPHLAVKDALEREKERRDIIPYARYRDLCAQEGIEDEEDQKALLALLHDLGVALDFRDEAGEPLCPDGVLNPNWVTNAVYRLITDQELRSTAAGRLTETMTRRILKDYEPWHRNLILNLLQRFELAYPAAADGTLYLPNAMPQDEPPAASDSAWSAALTFEYAYPELPESVITRFIVRAHEWIDSGQVWRWGVLLAWDENRALVRASAADKKIEIRVTGQENTRREMLASIRAHFAAIHKTFTESAGQEAFPIQEFICPAQYPSLRLDYHKLLTYERDGLAEIPETWDRRVIRLNVHEVLNGFVTPESRREDRERLFPEERRMKKEEDKSVRIEVHGNLEGGNIIIGKDNQVKQTIHGSFNAGLSPEVQDTLKQLTAAVQAMLKSMPAEQAEETRDNLEHLQEELKKPKPNRKWYSVSIEGLIQAAENVGKVGAPVVELAGKLLKLLG